MYLQRSTFLAFLMFASATSFAPRCISSFPQTISDAELKLITSQNKISNKRKLTRTKIVPAFSLGTFSPVQTNYDSITSCMTSDDSMDHEIEEPLANGVDSVTWLPTVIGGVSSEPGPNEDTVSL